MRARPAGCVAVVAIAIACGASAAAAQPARGIDHDGHARAALATKRELACTDCHRVSPNGDLRGNPGHTWCFGECHDAPAKRQRGEPYTIVGGMRALCETCHPARALDGAKTAAVGAFEVGEKPSGPLEFAIALSHKAHSSAPCGICHTFATASSRPHARCVSCHERDPVKNARPMQKCAGCHIAAARPEGTINSPSPFAVAKTFSHRRHDPRVRASPVKTCERCHQGVAEIEDMKIAAPKKSTCIDCHDGARAFGTQVGCRRCHSTPRTLADRVRAPVRAFQHASHTAGPCASCHDERGRFTAAKGHSLCSSDTCHPTELASLQPVICSSCHVGSEPWLPQHIDSPTRLVSDFGTRYEHARHPAAADSPLVSCQACHLADPGRADAGLTEGHASCSGATCHDPGARAPPISDCEKCHVTGERVARRAAADGRPWSVHRTFAHRQHRLDRDGSALACKSCHGDGAAPPGRDLPPPAKKTCVRCHDGKTAFKVTGHGCRRCHRR